MSMCISRHIIPPRPFIETDTRTENKKRKEKKKKRKQIPGCWPEGSQACTSLSAGGSPCWQPSHPHQVPDERRACFCAGTAVLGQNGPQSFFFHAAACPIRCSRSPLPSISALSCGRPSQVAAGRGDREGATAQGSSLLSPHPDHQSVVRSTLTGPSRWCESCRVGRAGLLF